MVYSNVSFQALWCFENFPLTKLAFVRFDVNVFCDPMRPHTALGIERRMTKVTLKTTSLVLHFYVLSYRTFFFGLITADRTGESLLRVPNQITPVFSLLVRDQLVFLRSFKVTGTTVKILAIMPTFDVSF